jgi:hypothetical protein
VRLTARGLLLRGLLAGVAGGLVASLVALVVAWPALDAAVALEAAASRAHSAAGVTSPGHEVVVGRGVQRLGGVAGLALVGAVLGAGLAIAQVRASEVPAFRRSLHLGVGVLAAVVIIPQLRYPALPPGSPATGGDHLGAVVVGVGVVAAYLLTRGTARERGVLSPVVEVGLVAGAVVLALVGGAVLPDRTGDSGLPGDLLWDFRVGALATQVVLVTATAALLGVFLDLAQRRAALGMSPQPVGVAPAASGGPEGPEGPVGYAPPSGSVGSVRPPVVPRAPTGKPGPARPAPPA